MSEIWRSGAESAASSPAVIDRGGPVQVLERFPANMDDLGKFARRERNISTARVCVCVRVCARVLLEQTHNAGVTCVFNQTEGFTEVADCSLGPDRIGEVIQVQLSSARAHMPRKAPRADTRKHRTQYDNWPN